MPPTQTPTTSTPLPQPRRKHRLLKSCALIVVGFTLMVIGWGVWTLASTGLYHIPVVSALAYKPVQPIRVVVPGTPVETYLSDALTLEFARRVRTGSAVNDPFTVKMPEQAITRSLQDILAAEAGEHAVDVERAQVAMGENEGVEIYLPFTSEKDRSSVIMAQVHPTVVDGELRLEVRDIWLGAWHVPGILLSTVVNGVVEDRLQVVNEEITRFGTLEEIIVEEGTLSITGALSTSALPF